MCGQIAGLVADTLRDRQVEIVVEDLAGTGFDPVISQRELAHYFDGPVPVDVAALVEHVRAAEELIFVLPIWMYAMPALLKGYFDRVWRPHVSFELEDGRIRPLLLGVKRLTVIATHGMTKDVCDEVGDGTRAYFATSLPSSLPGLVSNTRFDLYGIDTLGREAISREIARIREHFAARR